MEAINNQNKALLDKLILLTKESKLKWIRENPSTLYFELKNENSPKFIASIMNLSTSSESYNISNGKIVNNSSKSYFIFSIKRENETKEMTYINTLEDPEFEILLNNLYEAAENYLGKNQIDFIDNFLEDLSNSTD